MTKTTTYFDRISCRCTFTIYVDTYGYQTFRALKRGPERVLVIEYMFDGEEVEEPESREWTRDSFNAWLDRAVSETSYFSVSVE